MKKGFTLIELLAVIVILAIIALIAVPIVLNIINDSKNSSDEQSVELYIDSVKKAIARRQLEDNSFNPSTCVIQNSGNILCGNVEVIIDMKGTKPKKGIIKIKDNKLTYKNLLLNGNYYNKITELVLDNNNNGKPDIGDKYTYKVNDTDTFNFYVLSINSDNTVNLIMDRNICNDGTTNYTSENNYCRYAWYGIENNNTYGPVTAIQELYSGTKDWDNVPDMVMNYTDENNVTATNKGYTSIITDNGVTTIIGKPTSKITSIGTNKRPLKARLPQKTEVFSTDINDNTVCQTGNENASCPVWLIENLRYVNVANDKYSINSKFTSKTAVYKIEGYWLLYSYQGSTTFAHGLFYYGRGWSDFSTYGAFGVRPVITVPKDYLE